MNQRLIIALVATLGISATVLMEVHVIEALGKTPAPAMDAHQDSITAMQSDGSLWSLVRVDIGKGAEFVEDYNMSLTDCVGAMGVMDRMGDGWGWSCVRQPDMPGQPGGYIPNNANAAEEVAMK